MSSDLVEGGLEQQDTVENPALRTFSGLAQPVIKKIYEGVTIPTSLYHYTSSAGLIGIVTNHCLWFADATFMNDGSETNYGIQAISYAIDEFLADASSEDKDAGDDLKKEVENAMVHFQPVIFCFSARNNLLNQWRDYGRDVVPYCIEFDVVELEKWDDRNHNFPMFITKVVYDPALQRELMFELLGSIHAKAKEVLGDRQHFDEAEGKQLLVSAAAEIATLITRFKNPAFEAEEEWRAICYRPDVEAKITRKYRTSSLGVVPYYEWQSLNEVKNLPIKSVTVGPSPYAQVSDLALKQLLVDHGYQPETRYSTIPLRR